MAETREKLDRGIWNGCDHLRWLRSIVFAVFSGLILAKVSNVDVAFGAPVTLNNDTMVVSKQPLSGACVSPSGVVGDLSEWSTGCNKIVCHVASSGNYTVTYGCPDFEPSENPDTVNCAVVSSTTRPYPGCCPKIHCGSATRLTTLSPTSCFDISKNSTCQIWAGLTSGCTKTNAYVYNFTVIYCRKTCGYC